MRFNVPSIDARNADKESCAQTPSRIQLRCRAMPIWLCTPCCQMLWMHVLLIVVRRDSRLHSALQTHVVMAPLDDWIIGDAFTAAREKRQLCELKILFDGTIIV